VRDLVAALEVIRRRLLSVIQALENGDDEGAVAELERASEEWRAAVEEIRS
jgi:hypothetical protein